MTNEMKKALEGINSVPGVDEELKKDVMEMRLKSEGEDAEEAHEETEKFFEEHPVKGIYSESK